jgi:SAM-dependent methyltransferase
MQQHLYREHYELEEKHWWFVAKKRIIMSLLSDALAAKKDPQILDAGCGPGLMLKELAKHGTTCGMDSSAEALKFSRMTFGGDVRQGWLPDNVPFEKNRFDIITCLDVIEHIEDDDGSVKVLHALLRDKGVMIVTVPALMSLWSKWDDLNGHKRRYHRKELEELLVRSGFQIELISYYNTLLFPAIFAVRWFGRTFKRDSARSDTDMPGNLLNFILKKIFSIERFLLKFMRLPFGVSLVAVVRK